MNKASLLTRAAATVAAVALLLAAPAGAHAAPASADTARGDAVAGPAAPASAAAEATPIDLTGASDGGAGHVAGSGGSLVRTIVGLAIVIGVIYGVAWVLRQLKAARQPRATGGGLAALASVPLANGRSVHLVRAGTDLVLLGVAEQGVVPIRAYTQAEAQAAGLIDEHGMLIVPDDEPAAPATGRRLATTSAALGLRALERARQAARERRALMEARRAALARRTGDEDRPASGSGGLLDTLRAWTVRG